MFISLTFPFSGYSFSPIHVLISTIQKSIRCDLGRYDNVYHTLSRSL